MQALAIVVILVFAALMLGFALWARRRGLPALRSVHAFERLNRAVGLAVEEGTRLHVALGRGNMISPESAIGFSGLHVLEQVAGQVSMADRPPVASAGDGALVVMAQDALQNAYRSLQVESRYSPHSGRITGLTPFSYAAGAALLLEEEQVSANVVIGRFGVEAALLLDAADRRGNLTIAGSDDLTAQAIIAAAADEPMLGEQAFAAGAYLKPGGLQSASLSAQDVLRWAIAGFIVIGAVLYWLGFDLSTLL